MINLSPKNYELRIIRWTFYVNMITWHFFFHFFLTKHCHKYMYMFVACACLTLMRTILQILMYSNTTCHVYVKLKLSYLDHDCVCARIFFIPCNKETYFFRNRLNSSNWDISTQFDYIRKIPFQFAIYKGKFFFTIITLLRIRKEDNLLFIITMS